MSDVSEQRRYYERMIDEIATEHRQQIDQLEAENAKLRELWEEHAYAYEAGYRDGSIHYELDHCPACKNVADLQEALTENAKLRELVADMWKDMPRSESCAWDSRASCCTGECDGGCSFWHRMRELGVDI